MIDIKWLVEGMYTLYLGRVSPWLELQIHFHCYDLWGMDQSCPRVPFLGPDPTRRNIDPTRDYQQKVWPDPTRPDPQYVLCFVSSTFKLG